MRSIATVNELARLDGKAIGIPAGKAKVEALEHTKSTISR